jgi:hypothetical protein
VHITNSDIKVKYYSKKEKGKSVPLQARSGPEGSRKLRFPDFVTAVQDGGKVVSLTHRPHGQNNGQYNGQNNGQYNGQNKEICHNNKILQENVTRQCRVTIQGAIRFKKHNCPYQIEIKSNRN